MGAYGGFDDMDEAQFDADAAEREKCSRCIIERNNVGPCRHRGSRFWNAEQRGRENMAKLDAATRAAERREIQTNQDDMVRQLRSLGPDFQGTGYRQRMWDELDRRT